MKTAYLNAQFNTSTVDIPLKDVVANPATVAQVVHYLRNAERSTIAHTKDRGAVRGGGIKPWRQKGTGRARAGSSRSPLWRGGGVTFGPLKTDSFHSRLPHKMYMQVLHSLLAQKISDKSMHVIESVALTDLKTKTAVAWISKIDAKSDRLMLILDQESQGHAQAFRNIPYITLAISPAVSLLALLQKTHIIITKKALEQLIGAEVKQRTVKKLATNEVDA